MRAVLCCGSWCWRDVANHPTLPIPEVVAAPTSPPVFQNNGVRKFTVMPDVSGAGKLVSVSANGRALAIWNSRSLFQPLDIYTYEHDDVFARYRHSLNTVGSAKDCKVTLTNTVIGLDKRSNLVEVSPSDVVLRKFPFGQVNSFDICETANRMVVQEVGGRTIFASLDTAKHVRTLEEKSFSSRVLLSPCGQFICLTSPSGGKVYSAESGKLLNCIKWQDVLDEMQFISSTHLLLHSDMRLEPKILNILTSEFTNPKAGTLRFDCDHNMPVVSGTYAYCMERFYTGRHLVAYN